MKKSELKKLLEQAYDDIDSLIKYPDTCLVHKRAIERHRERASKNNGMQAHLIAIDEANGINFDRLKEIISNGKLTERKPYQRQAGDEFAHKGKSFWESTNEQEPEPSPLRDYQVDALKQMKEKGIRQYSKELNDKIFGSDKSVKISDLPQYSCGPEMDLIYVSGRRCGKTDYQRQMDLYMSCTTDKKKILKTFWEPYFPADYIESIYEFYDGDMDLIFKELNKQIIEGDKFCGFAYKATPLKAIITAPWSPMFGRQFEVHKLGESEAELIDYDGTMFSYKLINLNII